ncbi:MAG: alpha/beta hydrolase [Naasia sp.]
MVRSSAVVVSVALLALGVFGPSVVLAAQAAPFAESVSSARPESSATRLISAQAAADEGAPSAAAPELGQLITPDPAARDIALWWAGLDESERQDAIAEEPELIGNLDGIPYAVRDRVNRDVLARDAAEIRRQLDQGLGKGLAAESAQRLVMLEQIDEALTPSAAGPDRLLLVVDTAFPGKAAIALGDLETADYVSILVPGALLSVREHMAEWTKVTDDLYAEQTAWQATFDAPGTVATVSWIGYHTPDITNAVSLDLAEQAASALASFVGGVRQLHDGTAPYLSVFAHSYGSTATSMALSRGWMSVDAFAMIGSPGGEVQDVAQLGVTDDNVWVGEAPWDPIVNTAFFGVDPGSAAFGAHRMNVSGSSDPITGAILTASVGHDWYLEPGTESLRNLSLIGIDRGEFVTDGSEDDELKTLALLD